VILAAGLLVLLGLGLFVAGILTGLTVLYWACVGVCVVAAVLIVVARRRLGAAQPEGKPAGTTTPAE
jgi:membrane protein implicated in regulation of membrane protease activity